MTKMDKKQKEIKIGLHNGVCARRWNCKNLDKKCCNPIPKKGDNFIKCAFYIPKRKND